MSGALQAVFQNQRSFGAAPGQQAYTTAGTYTWVVPTGVTSISVVAVGSGCFPNSGNGGGGGALAYTNNIAVTPGESLTVKVDAGGAKGTSYLKRSSTSLVEAGSGGNGAGAVFYAGGAVIVGTGGGNGGSGGPVGRGGGGAGGYSGNGGSSTNATGTGGSGSGGGGGAGGGNPTGSYGAGGGGGVGILGQGGSGAGGPPGNSSQGGSGGQGGSSGASGGTGGRYIECCTIYSLGGTGGNYGGGGGFGDFSDYIFGSGAVRIIWPGNTRAFPSTNTGNL